MLNKKKNLMIDWVYNFIHLLLFRQGVENTEEWSKLANKFPRQVWNCFLSVFKFFLFFLFSRKSNKSVRPFIHS